MGSSNGREKAQEIRQNRLKPYLFQVNPIVIIHCRGDRSNFSHFQMGSVHVYHKTRASGSEIDCPRSRKLRNIELVRLMTAFDQAIVIQCDKSRANIY